MKENDKKIMRGEFRGDFTRDSFSPMKAFTRVLMQQGRVQVDADWNEQISILLHYMRNMACDIGGPHWGPKEGAGFEIGEIRADEEGYDFMIGKGHYYVKGILCELGQEIGYKCQPDYPWSSKLPTCTYEKEQNYLVYLDVWERHVSYVEDDEIREVALGGPDTASRAKIICQVKLIENNAKKDLAKECNYSDFIEVLESQNVIFPGTGKLQAKVMDKPKNDKKPCLVAPESRYRGAENQLYRVEIHKPGNSSEATFKWSRENGSVIYPILAKEFENNITLTLALEHLGRDERVCLKPDDWVEIVDDDYTLQNRVENLLRVKSINHENQQVTLEWQEDQFNSTVDISANKSPYLRRWDQHAGSKEGVALTDGWLLLENGVQILFSESNCTVYQTGDYWLIPARTATGDIEWPRYKTGEPKEMLPHGVIHHYAPLAIFTIDANGNIQDMADLRRKLIWIW